MEKLEGFDEQIIKIRLEFTTIMKPVSISSAVLKQGNLEVQENDEIAKK